MAKGSRGGKRSSGGGGVNPADIKSTRELVTQRGAMQTEVDEVLTAFSNVYDEYGYVVNEIQLATIGGKSKNTMAYYDGSNIAFNESYFSKAKIEKSYDDCVKSGFHPSKGNKTALEAVAAHELGHGLTDKVAAKMGISGIDNAATKIVNEARTKTKHRGVVQLAGKISGYATHSNAEAVAEAFADVYCNGRKAKSESRAIVDVVNSYLK